MDVLGDLIFLLNNLRDHQQNDIKELNDSTPLPNLFVLSYHFGVRDVSGREMGKM